MHYKAVELQITPAHTVCPKVTFIDSQLKSVFPFKCHSEISKYIKYYCTNILRSIAITKTVL